MAGSAGPGGGEPREHERARAQGVRASGARQEHHLPDAARPQPRPGPDRREARRARRRRQERRRVGEPLLHAVPRRQTRHGQDRARGEARRGARRRREMVTNSVSCSGADRPKATGILRSKYILAAL